MEGVTSLAPADGECYLIEHFLDKAGGDRFFRDIEQTARWHQPQLTLFGKPVRSPRLAAWYGDPEAVYSYSGLVNEPLPWFESLRQLRRRVEEYSGARFNSVLINLYRDGNDAMGWHSDDEPELVSDAPIASLSLGATRRFLMRHKRRRGLSMKIPLHHGSLLLMCGETQQHWRHAVPRTKKPVGARINLTFRLVGDSDVVRNDRKDSGTTNFFSFHPSHMLKSPPDFNPPQATINHSPNHQI